MKRRSILLLMLLMTGNWLYSGVPSSFADNPPARQGTGFYVQNDWLDQVPWGSGTIWKAYRKGYHANAGAPSRRIFLHFGRQLYQSGSWGVVPIGGSYKSNDWARSVANAFMRGYNDNASHETAEIVISTSTSNYNWTCENNDPQNVSTNWYISGLRWGELVNSVTSYPRVIIRSGNDIESWTDEPEFGDWEACGAGVLRWYDGFEDAPYRPNYNFGNNPYAEDTAQWTQRQAWLVSWGRNRAYVYPQIYCRGSSWAPSWVDMISNFYMRFDGVTSENGQTRNFCGGSPSLSWQDSWNELNTALANAGYTGNTLLGVAIEHYTPGR